MSRKLITDWDEYVEHRQEVRYRYWKRLFTQKVDEARDKEAARQYYSVLSHGVDLITTPQSIVGRTIIPDLVDTAYGAKVDYYAGLYKGFKTTWQLHQRKPVAIFLKDAAPESVRMYRLRLANPFNWDAQQKAQTEAAEYIQSDLGKKEIVDWLAFCFARERFTDYLDIGENPTNQKDLQSVHHPIAPFADQVNNTAPPTTLPNLVVKKRKGPKKETTRTDYDLIVSKMKWYTGNGMSKKAAMLKVGKEVDRSERVIYVAIKESDL